MLSLIILVSACSWSQYQAGRACARDIPTAYAPGDYCFIAQREANCWSNCCFAQDQPTPLADCSGIEAVNDGAGLIFCDGTADGSLASTGPTPHDPDPMGSARATWTDADGQCTDLGRAAVFECLAGVSTQLAMIGGTVTTGLKCKTWDIEDCEWVVNTAPSSGTAVYASGDGCECVRTGSCDCGDAYELVEFAAVDASVAGDRSGCCDEPGIEVCHWVNEVMACFGSSGAIADGVGAAASAAVTAGPSRGNIGVGMGIPLACCDQNLLDSLLDGTSKGADFYRDGCGSPLKCGDAWDGSSAWAGAGALALGAVVALS